MKKTYQKPQTDTTKVQPHLMAQLSKMEGEATNSEVLSRRRGSNWEDDEEDY